MTCPIRALTSVPIATIGRALLEDVLTSPVLAANGLVGKHAWATNLDARHKLVLVYQMIR